MVYSRVIILLFLSTSVLSEGDLLTPCAVDDTECLRKTTQQFLEMTCKGIKDFDIRPIDPLLIPELDIALSDKAETILHFKHLIVTGLKNQNFSQFKMDTKAKSVVLQTEVDLNVDGEVTVELKSFEKSFTGTYQMQGTALGTAMYGYDFTKDDKGVEHYVVGPETLTCQAVKEPKVTIGPSLQDAIDNDKDLKEKKQKFNAKRKEFQQTVFCKIVEKAYVTVVHNIRAAARVLPKSAFLKGV